MENALETFPELRARLQSRSGTMSGGQQQMLALAQAVISRPRYLLADELSFGLAPVVVGRLVPVLQKLAEQGIGILLIEQFTHIALKIADVAYVLERGRICFHGEPGEPRAQSGHPAQRLSGLGATVHPAGRRYETMGSEQHEAS
ncbi:ABC transporter ATP-binding protein (plasmid) [Bradyrhizobium guangxiense]